MAQPVEIPVKNLEEPVEGDLSESFSKIALDSKGRRLKKPRGFQFKICPSCRIKNHDQPGYPLCSDCTRHSSFRCTCTEEGDPKKTCNLCFQLDYFKKWPQSWRYYYSTEVPTFKYLLCLNCMCSKLKADYQFRDFAPCKTCQEGLYGQCSLKLREPCEDCSYCTQYKCYLHFRATQELAYPF